MVDPTAPGGAPVAEVARRSVADGGRLAATVDEPSVTATVDVVVAALRARDDAPLALVDAALVSVPTVYGDVVAEPDGAGRLLRLAAGEVGRVARAGGCPLRPRRRAEPRGRHLAARARARRRGRRAHRPRGGRPRARPGRLPGPPGPDPRRRRIGRSRPRTPSTSRPCGFGAPRGRTTGSCRRSSCARSRAGSPGRPCASEPARRRSPPSRCCSACWPPWPTAREDAAGWCSGRCCCWRRSRSTASTERSPATPARPRRAERGSTSEPTASRSTRRTAHWPRVRRPAACGCWLQRPWRCS